MSDLSAGSTLVEIAAARALQWNVEFDRGLRSSKPGLCLPKRKALMIRSRNLQHLIIIY